MKNPLTVVAVPDHFDVHFALGPDSVRVTRCDTAQAAADWVAAELDAADGPIPPKPPKGPTP